MAAHAELVTALRDPAAYAHSVDIVEVCETHISSVLLAGEYAYKLKKPVDLGFANFSTLARRRHYCQEELRLNRRTAPSLYLEVVPVTGSMPTRGPDRRRGRILDYAVHMRRFDPMPGLIERRGRGLDTALIDRPSKAIATFHARAAPPRRTARTACRRRPALQQENPAELMRLTRDAGRTSTPAATGTLDRSPTRTQADGLRRAPSTGIVRECHGDLHLGNMVLVRLRAHLRLYRVQSAAALDRCDQ